MITKLTDTLPSVEADQKLICGTAIWVFFGIIPQLLKNCGLVNHDFANFRLYFIQADFLNSYLYLELVWLLFIFLNTIVSPLITIWA